MSIIHDALNKIQHKRRNKISRIADDDTSSPAVNTNLKQSYNVVQPQAVLATAHDKYTAVLYRDRISSLGRSAARIFSRKTGIWVILLTAVLSACLFGGYSRYIDYAHRQHMQTRLVLNGVFVSNGMKVAMINNQSYQIGDKIGDIKVMNIGHEGVRLRHENKDIDLQVAV